jgi:hypothetical protein
MTGTALVRHGCFHVPCEEESHDVERVAELADRPCPLPGREHRLDQAVNRLGVVPVARTIVRTFNLTLRTIVRNPSMSQTLRSLAMWLAALRSRI